MKVLLIGLMVTSSFSSLAATIRSKNCNMTWSSVWVSHRDIGGALARKGYRLIYPSQNIYKSIPSSFQFRFFPTTQSVYGYAEYHTLTTKEGYSVRMTDKRDGKVYLNVHVENSVFNPFKEKSARITGKLRKKTAEDVVQLIENEVPSCVKSYENKEAMKSLDGEYSIKTVEELVSEDFRPKELIKFSRSTSFTYNIYSPEVDCSVSYTGKIVFNDLGAYDFNLGDVTSTTCDDKILRLFEENTPSTLFQFDDLDNLTEGQKNLNKVNHTHIIFERVNEKR